MGPSNKSIHLFLKIGTPLSFNVTCWFRILDTMRFLKSIVNQIKTHVRGFFDTDLHEVSWHFATHEAVRPIGF